MNDETYEALKRLTDFLEMERKTWEVIDPLRVDLDMVNSWIDEVAKEYN